MWNIIGRVDWMTVWSIEKNAENIEEKLGETYWQFFKNTEQEILDHNIISGVDRCLIKLCEANGIDRDQIKLHIIKSEEVNAFALPDRHMVVFSGLILDSDDESELCGVLAHELAHIELGHLMKKLVKEVGLAVLLSMTSGTGSPEMAQQAFKILTSTAFDRNLETDADLKAVEYLANSNINPEGLANFLFRLSADEGGLPDQLFWLSTHPGGEERSGDILDQMKGLSIEEERIFSDEEWTDLKEEIKDQ